METSARQVDETKLCDCRPRPGLVDVRGKAGASRAALAALRTATDRSPEGLAATLAAVVAAGDPRAGLVPLFD